LRSRPEAMKDEIAQWRASCSVIGSTRPLSTPSARRRAASMETPAPERSDRTRGRRRLDPSGASARAARGVQGTPLARRGRPPTTSLRLRPRTSPTHARHDSRRARSQRRSIAALTAHLAAVRQTWPPSTAAVGRLGGRRGSAAHSLASRSGRAAHEPLGRRATGGWRIGAILTACSTNRGVEQRGAWA
jgi:hypothetical protein